MRIKLILRSHAGSQNIFLISLVASSSSSCSSLLIVLRWPRQVRCSSFAAFGRACSSLRPQRRRPKTQHRLGSHPSPPPCYPLRGASTLLFHAGVPRRRLLLSASSSIRFASGFAGRSLPLCLRLF